VSLSWFRVTEPHTVFFFLFFLSGGGLRYFEEGMEFEQGETNNDLGSNPNRNGDLCPSLMPTGAKANSGHEVGVFGEVRKCFTEEFSRVREFGNE